MAKWQNVKNVDQNFWTSGEEEVVRTVSLLRTTNCTGLACAFDEIIKNADRK